MTNGKRTRKLAALPPLQGPAVESWCLRVRLRLDQAGEHRLRGEDFATLIGHSGSEYLQRAVARLVARSAAFRSFVYMADNDTDMWLSLGGAQAVGERLPFATAPLAIRIIERLFGVVATRGKLLRARQAPGTKHRSGTYSRPQNNLISRESPPPLAKIADGNFFVGFETKTELWVYITGA